MAITRNVGGTDKTVRIIAGVALPAFALLYGGGVLLRGLAGVVGVTALTTGLTGYCPFNSLFGINTRKGSRADNVPLTQATRGAGMSSTPEKPSDDIPLTQENRALLH